MPSTQTDMALRFAQLHRGPTAFVMPDDWGAGSAQILAQLEDATGDPSHPIYDFNAAVECRRCRRGRARPFKFTLTARAENFIRGIPDLDDTIRRLQAF